MSWNQKCKVKSKEDAPDLRVLASAVGSSIASVPLYQKNLRSFSSLRVSFRGSVQ